MSFCQRGIGQVSPRRCNTELTTNAAQAIAAAIRAVWTVTEPVPENGWLCPHNTRAPGTAPTRKQHTVAQNAFSCCCKASSMSITSPSKHTVGDEQLAEPLV